MTDIKLIAMDMDGTLLGPTRGVLPPENLAALQEASRRGIHLCFASGRAPDDLSFHAIDAGLDVHILALNGSIILEKPLGATLSNRPLQPEDARKVYRFIEEAKIPCAVFCEHDLVLCDPPDFMGARKIQWGTFMDRDGGRTRTMMDPAELDSRFDRVSKFVVSAITEVDKLPPLRRRIEEEIPGVEVTSSWIDNLEINARGVNKGSALQLLADSLGIPMAQVMAIGDNDNDISMLRAAGIGVAMGNATANAMAAADVVTLPCLENGVAAAVRALALHEDIPGVRWLK